MAYVIRLFTYRIENTRNLLADVSLIGLYAVKWYVIEKPSVEQIGLLTLRNAIINEWLLDIKRMYH